MIAFNREIKFDDYNKNALCVEEEKKGKSSKKNAMSIGPSEQGIDESDIGIQLGSQSSTSSSTSQFVNKY